MIICTALKCIIYADCMPCNFDYRYANRFYRLWCNDHPVIREFNINELQS